MAMTMRRKLISTKLASVAGGRVLSLIFVLNSRVGRENPSDMAAALKNRGLALKNGLPSQALGG